MKQSVVDVAVAVVEHDDGRFLLAQRPIGKVYEGYWEFPGGKVEPGEPIAHALNRELREELGMDVELAYPWITRVYAYPHATVRLHFYRVVRWRGEPHPHERQALSWQYHHQLNVSPILPANAPILKALSLPTSLGITCAWESGVETALERLRLAVASGLRLVQVREMNLDPAAREIFAAHAVREVREVGGIVVINCDVRLATILGSGLHLPSRELMSATSRPDVEWCSASCHDANELEKARDLGLDFVLLGPIQATHSHSGVPGMGWTRFADLIQDYSLPVFALGGMQLANLDEARRRGAHGVAMVRGAWEQEENQGSSSSIRPVSGSTWGIR
ncbi:MAG: Nudix family hydrolase [Prolixibacteraceae bacterium]|nr:Nudix family hydrolase [Burkholderiales bacterium]